MTNSGPSGRSTYRLDTDVREALAAYAKQQRIPSLNAALNHALAAFLQDQGLLPDPASQYQAAADSSR